MTFPLAEWIDRHDGAPHNLARSGMRGELTSRGPALRHLPSADADALRRSLGRLHSTNADRVFLTHGATEGTFVTLAYLAHRVRERHRRSPRLRLRPREYPPMWSIAAYLGYRVTSRTDTPVDVAAMSEPNNPDGRSLSRTELREWCRGASTVVVDETFREFSGRPTRAGTADPRLWVIGTFTKAYGADEDRVGFILPSRRDTESFAPFHGVVLDGLPSASVRAARGLLAHRWAIIGEARSIFRANFELLRERVPEVPPLDAPIWFDRGPTASWGDTMARAALRSGVLVCPGRYFGDASGVRLCLTRRSFPQDLEAYLRAKERLLSRRR